MYLGTKDELTREVNKVMVYPSQARRMGIEGKVLASIWVDEQNAMSNVKIEQGISIECDREVIKGLESVKDNWIAGTKDGKRAKAQYFVVLEFSLAESSSSVKIKVL